MKPIKEILSPGFMIPVIILTTSLGSTLQSCDTVNDILNQVQIFTTENQFIDDATIQVEVTTGLPGSGKTFNDSQQDTYCKLTINTINTVSKRIESEFHFAVRDKDGPMGSDYLSAANGTFTFTY